MRDTLIEPPAKQDLVEAVAFYEQQREGLGSEFLNEVKDYLPRIAGNPRLYAPFRSKARKATMSRFPYVIIYLFDDEKVYVLGIMHGRRSPRAMAGRLRHKK